MSVVAILLCILILYTGINRLSLFKHITQQLFSYMHTSVIDDERNLCCFTPIFLLSTKKATPRWVSSLACCFSMDSAYVLNRALLVTFSRWYIVGPSPYLYKGGFEILEYLQKERYQNFPIKREGVGKIGRLFNRGGITFHTS